MQFSKPRLPKFNWPYLPKWPALVVAGQRITREQAAIVNVRTTSLYWSTNDHAFARSLNQLLDIPDDSKYWEIEDEEERGRVVRATWDRRQAATDELQILSLEYLSNSNVCSAWIGGAHGWCDWQGNIGCRSFNIGKWPSAEDVYVEWRAIAKAFPFLKLRAQLFNGETCDESIVPVIEYRVSSGRVKVVVPTAPLEETRSVNVESAQVIKHHLSTDWMSRERGCSLECYKEAVELTRKSLCP